jgi:hypothetical protein
MEHHETYPLSRGSEHIPQTGIERINFSDEYAVICGIFLAVNRIGLSKRPVHGFRDRFHKGRRKPYMGI